MAQVILKIGGLTCSACSSGLEKYLSKQKGIKEVNVNLILSIATITYENLTKKEIINYIKSSGFEYLGDFHKIQTSAINNQAKTKLIIFAILNVYIMYISMNYMFRLPNIPYLNHFHPLILAISLFILTCPFLIYGFDILKNGIKNLINKYPNMDTLVTFSVVCSLIYSIFNVIQISIGKYEYLHSLYFETICMIIYFTKLGRFIEEVSINKTKNALQHLVLITPEHAIKKQDNKELIITIDEIKKHDTLICKPGDKFAVDGRIIKGKTYVDESFITGESQPVLKTCHDKVLAGSLNYEGYIEYEALKIGRESTISEIVKLVINATSSKNKIQKLVDKISGYFVPIIIIIAIITFFGHLLCHNTLENSLIYLMTVLVIACPCALGLAVPLVVILANGICAKKGLFIQNSQVLEKIKGIDTIVFDKTGTLTYGKLKVFKCYNYSQYLDQELLNIVANLEKKSSHPLSTAFKIDNNLNVLDFKILAGEGIMGKIDSQIYYLGNEKLLKSLKIDNNYQEDYANLLKKGCSIIFVIENKKIIGLIGVKDTIRANLKSTITKFSQNNITPIMLTGDNYSSAQIIAQELGITQIIANVSPQEKVDFIKELITKGKKVIMVGDGINDAPALSLAHIAISVSEGTDIAISSSDIILLNNNLDNIFDFLKISKQAFKIIKQNLFWAFIYNLIMIPIACGLLVNINIKMNPMYGSIAMIFSSLTVIFNSLRLERMVK